MKPICVISCPIDTFSGYGARSRDFVKALIQLKDKEWNIKIMPQRWGETPWNFLSPNDPLRERFIANIDLNNRPDVWVQISIPNEFQPVGSKLNIGVTAGVETNVFPQDWIEGLNKMNLNLVSSKHSKDVILNTAYEKIDSNTKQKVGVLKCEAPVEILFEGLDLNKYFKIQKPKSTLLKDISEDFCFLYTGHWLPGEFGEDRKNTALMIKTFLQTFNSPGSKKPALVLKTSHVDNSILDRESLIEKINMIKENVEGSLPNIYLLHGELTDEEMNLLNNDPKVKVFLSFTKGEGFGRPLLEGAITGKPTIATNWSGHLDFLNPLYNVLIGGELKPIHESAANKWLIKGSYWFNIDTDIAKKAMKDIFKHYKKYWEKSRKQTQYIKDNWTFDKMVEKLNTLLKSNAFSVPEQVGLKLPKLKKIGENKLPKLKKLPKLQKINT
tara:strand:+ start:1586 stop:2908 length:1323 start_codon:yes stop_codon:yes gene_type:complete